jgi:hypothetical protein
LKKSPAAWKLAQRRLIIGGICDHRGKFQIVHSVSLMEVGDAGTREHLPDFYLGLSRK